jgi:hypothetical protein
MHPRKRLADRIPTGRDRVGRLEEWHELAHFKGSLEHPSTCVQCPVDAPLRSRVFAPRTLHIRTAHFRLVSRPRREMSVARSRAAERSRDTLHSERFRVVGPITSLATVIIPPKKRPPTVIMRAKIKNCLTLGSHGKQRQPRQRADPVLGHDRAVTHPESNAGRAVSRGESMTWKPGAGFWHSRWGASRATTRAPSWGCGSTSGRARGFPGPRSPST